MSSFNSGMLQKNHNNNDDDNYNKTCCFSSLFGFIFFLFPLHFFLIISLTENLQKRKIRSSFH